MQMIFTGSVRLSLENWLTFPPAKDSPRRWPGLSSGSLWSVLFLECLGHWRHQLRSLPEEAARLRAGYPRMTCCGEEMLSLVEPLCWPLGVASVEEGVAEAVQDVESAQKPRFRSGNLVSWPINCVLFPLRSLALSQRILWWEGGEPSSIHVGSWERRLWVGLFLCPCLSKFGVYPYLSKGLVPIAGRLCVSKIFSQLTFPVIVFKLMMRWNISLGCLQIVLRNAWKLFSHFHNWCQGQAWSARAVLKSRFWFFQAGPLLCFNEIFMKSGFSKLVFSKTFSFAKFYPIFYVWEYKPNCCKTKEIWK